MNQLTKHIINILILLPQLCITIRGMQIVNNHINAVTIPGCLVIYHMWNTVPLKCNFALAHIPRLWVVKNCSLKGRGLFASIYCTRNGMKTCEWDEYHIPLISNFLSMHASKCDITFEHYPISLPVCSICAIVIPHGLVQFWYEIVPFQLIWWKVLWCTHTHY